MLAVKCRGWITHMASLIDTIEAAEWRHKLTEHTGIQVLILILALILVGWVKYDKLKSE